MNLRIAEDEVLLPVVKTKLKDNGRLDLINDLIKLNDDKFSWYSELKKLRNSGLHRKIINVRVSVNIHENIGTGNSFNEPTRVYFKDSDTALELIPYLEDRIQRMQVLIQRIISKEPLLRTP